MTSSFQKQYESAKWQAKAKALQYENQMLKSLLQNLVLGTQSQSSEHRPSQINQTRVMAPESSLAASNLVFTREDFVDDAEVGEEEFFEEEEEEEEGYYDSDGNFQYCEYDEEAEGDGHLAFVADSNIDDDEIVKAYQRATEGRENRTSSNQRGREKFEEKLQIEKVDFQRQSDAMRELFGSRAEEVFAAETQLQLKFNKFCDQLQPTLWPCIPLNCKFD